WGDGVFMGLPVLARYGQLWNDSTYTNDETSKQLLLYHDYLKNPNGLHYHAWAECRTATPTWTTADVKHAPESWCRAKCWYGVAPSWVLDILPMDHPNRAPLVAIMKGFIDGMKKWQDPATGRWFQIVDKPMDTGAGKNYLETSCSSMFTLVIAKAVRLGYVDASYGPMAAKGFKGVLEKISSDDAGTGANLTDICVGTNVGNLA